MHLENVVVDAVHPSALGRFYGQLLGTTVLTDTPELTEHRLSVGGATLDLCFPPVPEPAPPAPRLHLDLAGGARQSEVVAAALALGARPLDVGQGDVPWVVLADPEGNPFCVMEERDRYAPSGPVAALPLDSADPERDLSFWAGLTGWAAEAGDGPPALRHPSGRGPLLEMCPELAPKGGTKNRLHLDLRLEAGDDDAAGRVLALGGRELHPGWGELPWRVFTDPSGNELCLLPAR